MNPFAVPFVEAVSSAAQPVRSKRWFKERGAAVGLGVDGVEEVGDAVGLDVVGAALGEPGMTVGAAVWANGLGALVKEVGDAVGLDWSGALVGLGPTRPVPPSKSFTLTPSKGMGVSSAGKMSVFPRKSISVLR